MEQVINATPDAVWNIKGDFAAWDQWLPSVDRSAIISGNATEKGAVRKFSVGDKSIEETLKSCNPQKRQIKSKISKNDISVLPVSNYSSTLLIKEAREL